MRAKPPQAKSPARQSQLSPPNPARVGQSKMDRLGRPRARTPPLAVTPRQRVPRLSDRPSQSAIFRSRWRPCWKRRRAKNKKQIWAKEIEIVSSDKHFCKDLLGRERNWPCIYFSNIVRLAPQSFRFVRNSLWGYQDWTWINKFSCCIVHVLLVFVDVKYSTRMKVIWYVVISPLFWFIL